MCDSLKLGISTCRTSAWIDVLALHGERKQQNGINSESIATLPSSPSSILQQSLGVENSSLSSVGFGFHLPIVLICCGIGDFFQPFHLDCLDAVNTSTAHTL